VILWDLQIRNSFCRNLLELSAVLWYNDVNNSIRCGGLADMMWLATGDMVVDLSKIFLKNVLEIVLETKILEPYEVSGFENDKTPKALDFTGNFSVI